MRHLEPGGRIAWSNFHKTVVDRPVDAWSFTEPRPTDAATHFAETSAEIGDLMAASAGVGGLRPTGSQWSFNEAILLGGTNVLEVRHKGQNGIFPVAAAERARAGDERLLYLVSAGTTVHELNAALGTNASIVTSGAHDGQTIGGMLGTGVHGSVLEFGAFQDHVRGIQIVTGAGASVWIERGPDPILAPDFVARFATRTLLDEDSFEAAAVHLGGLGVVNAVLMEVVDGYTVDFVQRKKALTRADVELLEAGEFRRFAEIVWPDTDADPYYVQVVLDPYQPYEGFGGREADEALITLLFKRAKLPMRPMGPVLPSEHDPLSLMGDGYPGLLAQEGLAADMFDMLDLPRPGEIAFLAMQLRFRETPADGETPERKTWGEVNGRYENPPILGISIDFFNSAYAVERNSLASTLDTMLEAFNTQILAPAIITLRFVKKSAGLLAFTHFDDSVVISLDGLRGLQLCELATERVARALDGAGVPYAQHWGKQGDFTPARFVAAFGDPADPGSRAGRWRRVRESLLDEAMREALASPALQRWGLA